MSETATGGHETIIQGLLGQGVEQVPHKWFVGGMHRPERNLVPSLSRVDVCISPEVSSTRPSRSASSGCRYFGRQGLAEKLLPEPGVGDADQGHGPFPHAFAVQVGHPVFGHHVMNLTPGGDHPGPVAEKFFVADQQQFGLGREHIYGVAFSPPKSQGEADRRWWPAVTLLKPGAGPVGDNGLASGSGKGHDYQQKIN